MKKHVNNTSVEIIKVRMQLQAYFVCDFLGALKRLHETQSTQSAGL